MRSKTKTAPSSAAADDTRSPFIAGPAGIRYPAPIYANAFIGLLRAAESLERALDAELRQEHGIGLRAYEVLLHLGAFSATGHLRMTQLIEQAPLSQSRVSRLVAELEGQRLVQRIPDVTDSRAVLVKITDAGGQKLREAQVTHHEGLRQHFFSRLTLREITQLATITRKIVESPNR